MTEPERLRRVVLRHRSKVSDSSMLSALVTALSPALPAEAIEPPLPRSYNNPIEAGCLMEVAGVTTGTAS